MRRLLLFVTVALCLTPVAHAAATTARPLPEAVVPVGFSDSLVAGGLSVPTAVTAMPDGRALVLQKGGQVRVVSNGALLPTAALDLASVSGVSTSGCTDSERGLLGIALDPDFGANGHVYLYFTRANASAPGGCVNRVSRFTMTNNTISPSSQVILLDNIGSPNGNHNGGDLAVGNDGFLYVAVGDGGCDPRGNSGCRGDNDAAQDLSLMNGKILRVNRTNGAPAAGNPYDSPSNAICRTRLNSPTTPTNICREIFALGLRNPWRFAFDPNTGATRFYINDVGQNAREEVNVGAPGANYGWPAREGVCALNTQTPCPPPAPELGYTQPLTDYSQDETRLDFGGTYVTGAAFVPNGAWGEEYDGGYLFADGGSGRIFHRPAVLGGPPTAVYTAPFATSADGVSDIEFVMEASGWALYYVSPSTGQLRKIVSNTGAAVLPTNSAAFFPESYRAFDSREVGPTQGVLRAGTSRLIHVTEAIKGYAYALVNITMVRPSSDAFAVAWSARRSRPPSSNINAPAGQVTANASIVPVDADGDILLFTSATSHVLVDVLGGYGVAASSQYTSGRYEPVTPVRAADTRQPANGSTNRYIREDEPLYSMVEVPIEGLWGVPTDTSAVAVIVTGLSGSITTSGYVSTFPTPQFSPQSSVNVNGFGDTRANLVVVPVGPDGSIYLMLRNVSHVIVDVVGSFTGSSAPMSSAGMYVGVPAARVVDTRVPTGFVRPAGGTVSSVNPSMVPDGALGVSQNIVMLRTSARSYLTSFPSGLPSVPNVSNANATGANQTRSAMAITSLGAGGGVSYFVSAATDVIVDVTGYYTPGPSS